MGWREFKSPKGRKGREGNVRQIEKGKLITLDIAEWENACPGKYNPGSLTNLPFMITSANFGKHHSPHTPSHPSGIKSRSTPVVCID